MTGGPRLIINVWLWKRYLDVMFTNIHPLFLYASSTLLVILPFPSPGSTPVNLIIQIITKQFFCYKYHVTKLGKF